MKAQRKNALAWSDSEMTQEATTDKKTRVLIVPAFSGVGIEITSALVSIPWIYTIGVSMPAGGNHELFDEFRSMEGKLDCPAGILEFTKIIEDTCPAYIFGAHDAVLAALAREISNTRHNKTQPLLHGAQLCGPLPGPMILCRSKRSTLRALAGHVPCPAIYELDDIQPQQLKLEPLFIKPNIGQGAQNATVVRSITELAAALDRIGPQDDALITEYLPGQEVSVDCFSNTASRVVFAQPRYRLRTARGISTHTQLCEPDMWPLFQSHASAISSALGMSGAWFFQMKQNAAGVYALLEVGARIAGGSALARARGVNLPYWDLQQKIHGSVPDLQKYASAMPMQMWRVEHSQFSIDTQNYDLAVIDADPFNGLGQLPDMLRNLWTSFVPTRAGYMTSEQTIPTWLSEQLQIITPGQPPGPRMPPLAGKRILFLTPLQPQETDIVSGVDWITPDRYVSIGHIV